MQSSNQPGSPYTEAVLPSKRNWKAGAAIFSLLSIAGGLAVNNYLNPPATTTTVTPIGTGTGTTTKPDKTVTSNDIPYQFGDVQLTVTRHSGKISAIDIGQSSANNGREAAFPILVQEAIKAQGSNFGNLSGATYTTAAFKAALDSAVSKLG